MGAGPRLEIEEGEEEAEESRERSRMAAAQTLRASVAIPKTPGEHRTEPSIPWNVLPGARPRRRRPREAVLLPPSPNHSPAGVCRRVRARLEADLQKRMNKKK